MLPNKGGQELNHLISLLANCEERRSTFHDLDRQRLWSKVANIPKNSPLSTVSEAMVYSFLYDFEKADRSIEAFQKYTAPDLDSLTNFHEVLLDCFRFPDFLESLSASLRLMQDNWQCLSFAYRQSADHGMFQVASSVGKQLVKLGKEPPYLEDVERFKALGESLGLTDSSVAEALEAGLQPLKRYINHQFQLTYKHEAEFVSDEPPETLAFSYYVESSVSELVKFYKESAEALCEKDYGEPVELHLVLSFKHLDPAKGAEHAA